MLRSRVALRFLVLVGALAALPASIVISREVPRANRAALLHCHDEAAEAIAGPHRGAHGSGCHHGSVRWLAPDVASDADELETLLQIIANDRQDEVSALEKLENRSIAAANCPADVNGDQVVNVNDLLAVINQWGWGPSTATVSVSDHVFYPPHVSVKAGDSIKWVWVSGLHTVTSGSNCTSSGLFNKVVSSTSPTATWNVPSTFSGTILYYCIPHCGMGMTGSIIVERITADIAPPGGDGIVNVNDLLMVISSWGPCE